MTPEDQVRLQQSVEIIADILYRNTPREQLQSLEGIEQAIRSQSQQYVMPQLGVFLLQQALQQRMAIHERYSRFRSCLKGK